jgi:small subunit ribosomal protein S9
MMFDEMNRPERTEAPAPRYEEKKEAPKILLVAPPEGARFNATGRRKTSVARVILRRGNGTITINSKPADQYMAREINVIVLKQPLELTGAGSLLDIQANVAGGGLSGQAGAIRHGIARALCEFNPELRTMLKRAGFLTRDARAVERKKYGMSGARKRFQFSKR